MLGSKFVLLESTLGLIPETSAIRTYRLFLYGVEFYERRGTYSNALYLTFSSGRKEIRWTYSVLGGILRSTNFMSFVRRMQRSCITSWSSFSALSLPYPSGRAINVLKTSGCSNPPVICRNANSDCRSLILLTLDDVSSVPCQQGNGDLIRRLTLVFR